MTEPLLPYRNPDLPVEARVNDLLQRMSLEEKAAQMQCVWREKAVTLVDELGAFDPVRAAAHFGHGHGLGQVGRPSDAGGGLDPRRTAELTNDIQRFFVEHSRLGIPVIFHEECLHGLAAAGATSFPQPIGLAATFDPELVRRLYAMTAAEARTRGAHQALTPVLDVARDPRWGRVEETFGEDPHLVGRMGVAAIQGFQGRGDVPGRLRLIATLKHFAAHGQPESGNNCAPANVSPRTLREVFLEPFRAAVVEGGAISVMASYNEIDGVPSHANRWLLRDVLRGEWEFPGYVVSDYDGIRELNERPELVGNYLAADPKAAARLAVQAGVNIELPDPDCYRHVVDLGGSLVSRGDTSGPIGVRHRSSVPRRGDRLRPRWRRSRRELRHQAARGCSHEPHCRHPRHRRRCWGRDDRQGALQHLQGHRRNALEFDVYRWGRANHRPPKGRVASRPLYSPSGCTVRQPAIGRHSSCGGFRANWPS